MAERTIIERVARAIWADRYPDVEWADPTLSELCREDFLGHARAAIEAMRVPTKAMEDQGQLEGDGFGRGSDEENWLAADGAKYIWLAMIDAALAEGADAGEKAGVTQAPSAART